MTARIAEKKKRISKVKSEAAELIAEKKKRISRAKSKGAELKVPSAELGIHDFFHIPQ